MSKLAQSTNKYTIYARFEADGTVEKPDVIGAVFGQTEGLLGQDMDLRELQRTGRVGRIEVERTSKRQYVIDRAKELLNVLYERDEIPETEELAEKLKETVRSSEITSYNGMPAGPNIENSDAIIIVEGRADVVNLLRCGVKNVIAIEGTSIPQAVSELSRTKSVTVFLDGDRGGDLILKELFATCEIDFIARAPEGKEVEELTKKEVFK